MAGNCVTAQYKKVANATGVHSISCTEGAAKDQAEQNRELANLANFRQMQRTLHREYLDSLTTLRRARCRP
jgi:hypothetical protein